jgi:alkanesulfonate monooxygenase SsuD/methylene tetrahydromethanopterin reductase-like flavin-dependent oxidoreductase (luciferase family)
MKFGLFDHVDRSDRPLAQQFDERLEFVAAADAAGFYCYHVAEHHGTPLNMVPVPGVFLGALARLTKRIRLGPLVYLLTLYSPLRLIEEIGMLDQLSYGRLDVGVGRGISPFELNFHNVDAASSRDIFMDAYDTLVEGLTCPRLTHKGPYFSYANVPMEIPPFQKPHPPFWYGSSNATGSTWAGDHGMHFLTNGPTPRAKQNIDTFTDALAKRGGAAIPKPEFSGGTAIGVNRQVVVADTNEQARRIAEPAHHSHYMSLTKLWRENTGVHETGIALEGLDESIAAGTVMCGTPDTVSSAIQEQANELGINYMNMAMFFGTMPLADALHSIELFSAEVMPRFASVHA